jgi:putative DNA primase/helicase
VSLISFGAPATSVNVADIIRWLTAFEDVNQHKIPLNNGSTRLGWQRDGSFLLPDAHIRMEKHQQLKLFPAEGMDPIMKSLRTGGTWEGWLNVAEMLREHPLAMLSIYASVAAVMQHITRCSNFAVDWSNETSSGKTTSLRVAASVWGYPADDDDEGFIYSWDSTKVWVERAAGFLHSLPVILDETKRVKNKQQVADVLYDFCSGKGRGRGTLQGVDKSNTWNTVLLSTGEQRLTSFTNDGGVRARVLALQGAPISGPAQTARATADTVRGRLYTHYGHLGRKVVQYLVYHKESWGDFRTAFENRRDNYAASRTPRWAAGSPLTWPHSTSHRLCAKRWVYLSRNVTPSSF